METYEYHFQLNPIVEDIADSFSRYPEISSKRLELEFKYAFLKNCKNADKYKELEAKSEKRPVIVSLLPNGKDFKINAACDLKLHENARQNLRKLEERAKFEKEEKYLAYYRGAEDTKYVFDSNRKCWNSLEKDRLFHRQYDVVSKRKIFRVDCSMKNEEKISLVALKAILMLRKKNRGFLRYKHAHIYHYEYFDIESSTIYETEKEPEFLELHTFLNSAGQDITQKLKLKMELQEKRPNIKYELELKMTEKGLDYVRQCKDNQLKEEVSKAFNALRDITDPLVIDEKLLIKLLEDLSLKEVERPIEKKEEVKQEAKEADKKQKKEQPQEQNELVFIVKRP